MALQPAPSSIPVLRFPSQKHPANLLVGLWLLHAALTKVRHLEPLLPFVSLRRAARDGTVNIESDATAKGERASHFCPTEPMNGGCSSADQFTYCISCVLGSHLDECSQVSAATLHRVQCH